MWLFADHTPWDSSPALTFTDLRKLRSLNRHRTLTLENVLKIRAVAAIF